MTNRTRGTSAGRRVAGLGGGGYKTGTFTEDALTRIFLNLASTGDDNLGP